MNKKEYLETMDMIIPPENVKSEIHDKVFHQSKHPKRTCWKAAAASFAIICMAAVAIPVVASSIQSLILERTPSYTPLADTIETSVYSKSDGHVEMSVEELLSDGIIVKMTVRYTALDDKGQQWLENFELTQNNLRLDPYMPDTTVYGTNYGRGTDELTDLSTENERVFFLQIESSSRDYSEVKGTFLFPMTESKEEVLLDISGNVEIQSYKLQSQQEASEYYSPTYIEISPMSFVIYANGHGVIEEVIYDNTPMETWILPDSEIDSLENNSYFIMKDDSKMNLGSGWHNTAYPKSENMYSDLMLYSSSFLEPMNIKDFEAVVINGVRFEFEE